MDKRIVIKRILSLFLAVVLVMGTVTVAVPKMAEAAENEITLSWSRYDSGFWLGSTVADVEESYYIFDSIYFDGKEIKNDIVGQMTKNSTFVIWSWSLTNPPTKSLEIKAGTTLYQSDSSDPWVKKEGGKTYTVTDDVRLISSDNGTTWVATEYKENTSNDVTVAFSNRWSDDEGGYVWEFDITNLPSDAGAKVFYRLETMTVDGIEQADKVWVEVQNTGKAYIWNTNWDDDKPTSSLLIKKGAILRKANQGNPWVSDPNGETLTITNNVYVTSSDNGTTWVATEYSETPAPPTPPAPSVTMREVTAEVAANSSATDFWLTTNPEVYTYYGDWAGAISKVLIDDVETSVQWYITSLGICINFKDNRLPENWTTVKVAKDTEFTINYNGGNKTDTTPFKITNDIVWSKANAKVSTDVKWESFELYVESDQLILRTDVNLNTLYPWGKLKGNVLLDGKAKEVEWNIEDNLIFTVDITCDEYQKAESVVVEKDTVFTLSADADKTIKLTNRFGLKKIGGAWLEESQTKAEYNDVKISLSSSDGRGFYLNAEIVAGPDKGKTIGGKDVYGDWKTSATGTITYNGTKTMDVFFSTTGSMIYISGDYDLSKITQIELKAGTVLLPMENAQCKTMLRLANDLKLAKDTRYNRWVLAGQENQQYQFNDVTLEVTRVTGAVLEMRGTFKNQSNKQLKDIYGDWVLLNGAITLGDPSTGTRTDEGAVWSLAGDLLMLYGVQAGIMDSIKIPSGTILWPDSSCKSENPIRIVYDVVLTRNADDEWVIQSGKPSAGNGGAQNNNSSSVESEKNETAKEELTVSVSKDVTNVRLVDAKSNETKKDKTTTASNNSIVYVAVGVASALLVALLVGCLVVAKKRKKGE